MFHIKPLCFYTKPEKVSLWLTYYRSAGYHSSTTTSQRGISSPVLQLRVSPHFPSSTFNSPVTYLVLRFPHSVARPSHSEFYVSRLTSCDSQFTLAHELCILYTKKGDTNVAFFLTVALIKQHLIVGLW